MEAKIYLGNDPSWKLEDLDRMAITIHEEIVKAGVMYYGFIYQPTKGFYLIAPQDLVNFNKKFTIEPNFDFKKYISTVPLNTLDIIWLASYQKLPPSLNRLYR